MRLFLPIVLLLLPLAAQAHVTGVSGIELRAEGRVVDVQLGFHLDELMAYLSSDVPSGDRRRDIEAATIDRLGIAVAQGACVRGPAEVRRDDRGGLLVRARYECPAPVESGIDLAVGHLARFGPTHRLIGTAVVGGRSISVTADASTPYVRLDGVRSTWGRFFVLGVEHIFTGFDHLLFLAAVILTARRLRSVVALVTSFTIAHSLTLALAVLGVVEIPGSIIEPAIAASIVFVAAENILRPRSRYRPALTFTFGLIHGFGFAGLLAELGWAQGTLLATLAGFNLGVEAGQLVVVLLAAPLLLALARRPWYERTAVPTLSVTIGLFGAYWFLERVLT